MHSKLSPEHSAMLADGSGISDEVIEARGYRTVDSTQELLNLGFNLAQAKRPGGLLIPVHTPDGQTPLHIYRPDRPRVLQPPSGSSGEPKILKYELPPGASIRLDCPPGCQPKLLDPAVPLWITEGVKKADALASRGLVALDLLGVWGFKGKNPLGGTAILPDFDYIAWAGRDVRIVFDSDVMTKATVKAALDRLTQHLRNKGAIVTAVYLPTEKGSKVGIDDYLVKHSVADLEGLIEAPRPQPQPTPPRVRLLPDAPPMLSRPLGLIDGRALAGAWLWTEVEIRERADRSGNVIRLPVPIVRKERRLFIVAGDGTIYGDGGDKPIEDLGVEIRLNEVPQNDRLWSMPSVDRFRSGWRPDPVDVFDRIIGTVDKFIDFERSLGPQREMTELIGCYILASWFLPVMPSVGFLWPNGGSGSGKTQLLSLVAELGHLGEMVLAGGSYASLRDLADYGGTICFDDAENMADPKKSDPDKRALLLAGNRRGSVVTVKEPGPDRSWQTRRIDAFCVRAFSATKLPDPILQSRSIVIPLIRTADRKKANSDPNDYAKWPCDRAQLVDDLWATALDHLPAMGRHVSNVESYAPVSGRDLEPWLGVLAVASWLEDCGIAGLTDRMSALATAYQVEKVEMLAATDYRTIIIRALARLLGVEIDDLPDQDQKEKTVHHFFRTADIKKEIDRVIEEDSIDVDPLSVRGLGKSLAVMRFRGSRDPSGKSRGFHVSLESVARWAVSMGMLRSSPKADPPDDIPPDDSLPPLINVSDVSDVSDVSKLSDIADASDVTDVKKERYSVNSANTSTSHHSVSIPSGITYLMREALYARGYTESDVDQMTPADVRFILDEGETVASMADAEPEDRRV